jgi:hypothetical protein
MYWSISPAAILGVLGQIRTALTEFVAELRNEVGDCDELPSAEQADGALRAALPSVIFNNSPVTFMTATTKNGDIMPDASRSTIKRNKTKRVIRNPPCVLRLNDLPASVCINRLLQECADRTG